MGLVMDVVVVVQNVGWSLVDVEGDNGPVATLVRGIISPFGQERERHVRALVAVQPQMAKPLSTRALTARTKPH